MTDTRRRAGRPSIDGVARRGEDGSGEDSASGVLIGRPFGVPVYVTPTWFIVAGLITYWFAPSVENSVPGIGPWKYAVSLGYAVLLYSSVLIHELAHTVVALRGGLPVRRISLYFLGGVSEIGEASKSARQEAWIAAAGPLVSVLLGLTAYVVEHALEPDTVGRLLAHGLMLSNLLVGAFNLLPGLPLDGGRVLSAAVWSATGRRHSGVVAAAYVGRAVAVFVLFLPALLGLTQGHQPDLIDLVWGALLASFIWSGATQALQAGRLQERIPGLSVRALTRRAIPVAADLPLAEALRRAAEAGARNIVVVGGDGAPVALVVEAAALATPESRRPWVPVSDVARRIQPELVVSADLAGHDLVEAISRMPASEYLVVEATGEVFGVLATADVERAVARA
jgi:Zn-dependent protease/CBS domain-containing protein